MNSFSAIGRIGRDAVTRYTQAGKAVTGWALAVESGWGENKKTTWLDCAIWGDRGMKLADHIRKGDRLGVIGEIATREHDGKTYITLDVKDVTLLGDKRESAPQQAPRPQAQRQPQPAPADDFADDGIPWN